MEHKQSMERLNKLLKNPLYREHYEKIQSEEKERPFCGHDFQHFLDVSRIGWIYVLERGLKVSKEVVYAYGFLHDLGRAEEYAGGQRHEEAGATIAAVLMKGSGFTDDESQRVISAILHHRDKALQDDNSFEGLMYRADKASRACLDCLAERQCNWNRNKKNMKIEV